MFSYFKIMPAFFARTDRGDIMIIKDKIRKLHCNSTINDLLELFKKDDTCEVVYLEDDNKIIGEISYDKVKQLLEEGDGLKGNLKSLVEQPCTADFNGFTEEETEYEIIRKFIAEKELRSLLVLKEDGTPLYFVVDESRFQRKKNQTRITLEYLKELEIVFDSIFNFYLTYHNYKKIAFLPDEMSEQVYKMLSDTNRIVLLEKMEVRESDFDIILGADKGSGGNFVSWYQLLVLLYDSIYNVYKKEDNMLTEALKKILPSNLCILRCPLVMDIEQKTEREALLAMHTVQDKEWFRSQEGIQVFCDGLKEYDGKKINEMMDFQFIGNHTGVHNIDVRNSMLNIIDGIRFTSDTPFLYNRTIHMFGPSTLFGVGVEDKHTISSYVQRYVNQKFPEKKIRVVNHGVPRADDIDIARLIRSTPVKSADMIVIVYSRLEENHNIRFAFEKIKYLDAHQIFQRPHDMGEIFLDTTHWNHKPNAGISEFLVEEFLGDCILNDNGIYDNAQKKQVLHNAFYTKLSQDKEFLKSIEELKQYRFQNSKKTGCIIMNANPFTLGHRGLIEMSLKHVENLYVFVVQEDRSYFSFKDRFAMVREGCKDLENVKVLPTGNVMASAALFPEYFQRDQIKKEVKFDIRKDITVMAGFIAPTLNITMRFMGTEPICPITRQLVQHTQELLPYYGVQLVIFDRIEKENEPISASSVRKYLKEKNEEAMRKIVPATTYDYLISNFMVKEEVTE